MNIEECLKEGFLKKAMPNKEEIKKEIEESKKDIEDARESFQAQKYKWCIVQAYYSMFHVARAVLFYLGYKERRHFAIEIVLKELVKNKKLESYFVDDFKAAMFAREEADYSSAYSKERSEQILMCAEEFIDRMKRLTNSKDNMK